MPTPDKSLKELEKENRKIKKMRYEVIKKCRQSKKDTVEIYNLFCRAIFINNQIV